MIVLIGNYLHDGQQSMQRFATALKRDLTGLQVHVRLISPRPFFGRLLPSAHGLGKWLGYLDKFLIFPFFLKSVIRQARAHGSVAVHICDHSNAPYCRLLSSVPHLLTCHDVLAIRSANGEIPENKTSWSGRLFQRWILSGLRQSLHIACDSEATREQLLALGEIPKQKASVVPVDLNHPYRPLEPSLALDLVASILRSREFGHLVGCPFLIHVGGNQWYKNRAGVVEIHQTLSQVMFEPPALILVGGQTLPETVRRRLLSNGKCQAVELGGLENEELRAFYSVARALLFPSLQEGFGWPIIEAQACGCPVITTDRAPMNQIGGPAALLIDPQNIDESASRISGFLEESAELRSKRIQTGRANAATYAEGRMAKSYIKLYQSLLNGHVSDESWTLGEIG